MRVRRRQPPTPGLRAEVHPGPLCHHDGRLRAVQGGDAGRPSQGLAAGPADRGPTDGRLPWLAQERPGRVFLRTEALDPMVPLRSAACVLPGPYRGMLLHCGDVRVPWQGVRGPGAALDALWGCRGNAPVGIAYGDNNSNYRNSYSHNRPPTISLPSDPANRGLRASSIRMQHRSKIRAPTGARAEHIRIA